MTFLAGIDEAGRGPVLGPMVMAICATQSEERLHAMGVRDSKQLTPEARERLARTLAEAYPHEIVLLTPQEIDASVLDVRDNLNLLEARTSAALILTLAQSTPLTEVIIDSPTVSTDKYEKLVREALDKADKKGITKKVKLTCKNKADADHPVVGAASILAKVARDAAIRDLEAKHGPVGSGYPSDPITQAFLDKHWREGHEFFRKSWKSFDRLVKGNGQHSLADFGPKAPEHAEIVAEFEFLKEHGFSFEEPTNQYEVVRMRKDKTTVIRYSTGKIVVQGPEKDAVERLLRRP